MRGRTSASLLDRVLATRPRAEPQPRADTLALAGRPLPPSLRAVLAHDATWLPALVDASVEDVALAAALALEEAIGGDRKPTREWFSSLAPLYPGRCFALEGPSVSNGTVETSFLYVGEPNADGEYPVLVYSQPDDAPAEIVIEAPSVDVWLAQRLKLIKGKVGARGSKLPKMYAQPLQDHADRHFNGCWGHELSEPVAAHAPAYEDTCAYLLEPATPPQETLIRINGEVADIRDLCQLLGDAVDIYRGGVQVREGTFHEDEIVLTPRGAPTDDSRALRVPTSRSSPTYASFRIECDGSPLVAIFLRAVQNLERLSMYVGYPYAEPNFLWMMKKSRALETATERDDWIDAIDRR